MIRKNDQESTLLSPFEAVFRDILEYYSQTRSQVFKLEKWDYQTVFDQVIKSRFGGDAQKTLNRLRETFHDMRLQETQHGKTYLGELRGLLWQSLDQIFAMVDSHRKDDAEILKVRSQLQKVMVAQDLKTAKKVVTDVLSSLVHMEKNRQQLFDLLQSSYKKQMETLQSELQMAHSQLQLDGLTQIYNRGTFDQQIRKTAQLSFLTGQKSCLIMLDIDHFKRVNDSYGHPAGDAVIQNFARALVQSFPRKSDFVARYGGEEFAVILQGSDLSETNELVAKVLVKIRGMKISHNDQDIAVTVSAGVALYQNGEAADQWLRRADKALYDAKLQGRDRLILAAS